MSVMPNSHFISTAGLFGGPDTQDLIDLLTTFNRLLQKHCLMQYSEAIVKISLTFEVGGLISEVSSYGVKKVAVIDNKMLSLRMSIPSSSHRGRSAEQLRFLLLDVISSGIDLAVKKLNKMDVEFDVLRFLYDVSGALSDFVTQEGPPVPTSSSVLINKGLLRLVELRQLAFILGETPPPLPLPRGWSIDVDPQDPDKVVFREI